MTGSSFFQQKEPLFGPLVEEKFPRASIDIKEAGKCFALDRYTACVVHLMRALEVGLESLANDLCVPYREQSWHTLLGRLEKKRQKIDMRKRKPKGWNRKRQFYAEAFSVFHNFKDAWRNYAAHGRENYDGTKAKFIFENVKFFMLHLAKTLSEVKHGP